MKYIIYETRCLTTGKVYIGKHQTKDLDDRYLGSGKYLNHAIKKYGRENFEKKILHIFDTKEEMNLKEAELVTEEFCERKDTFNICPGGKGGWGYLNNSSQQHIERTSRAAIKSNFGKPGKTTGIASIKRKKELYGNPFGPGYSFNNWKGRIHSEETKRKISLKAKEKTGSKNSQFGTIWITNRLESRKIKKDDAIPEGWKRGRNIYR